MDHLSRHHKSEAVEDSEVDLKGYFDRIVNVSAMQCKILGFICIFVGLLTRHHNL
ncbi:hypothetical protein [[Pantoea] beijingensis]|uniref:hypothetical protein n=1 Tax=[Pantoea] beijingensis TaxID=1324864 RepID=UPI0012AF1E88|nr:MULTISPECIES: hypothetical protein [Erwiniaceae]